MCAYAYIYIYIYVSVVARDFLEGVGEGAKQSETYIFYEKSKSLPLIAAPAYVYVICIIQSSMYIVYTNTERSGYNNINIKYRYIGSVLDIHYYYRQAGCQYHDGMLHAMALASHINTFL